MGRIPVLVVDDDEHLRELITGVLERDGEFESLEAPDGSGALRLMEERSVALVLLDVSLPDSCGLDVLRQIRRTSELPVILLTGRSTETDRVVGLELGADDYVVKPCYPREVLARVRSVLRRVGTAAEDQPLRFDGLTIDAARCEVWRDGERIELTARELALLLQLASHPRRVFTRDELLRAVWGSEPGWQGEATVTEHVYRLRMKLEADRRRPRWLTTVRGIGYRFEP